MAGPKTKHILAFVMTMIMFLLRRFLSLKEVYTAQKVLTCWHLLQTIILTLHHLLILPYLHLNNDVVFIKLCATPSTVVFDDVRDIFTDTSNV